MAEEKSEKKPSIASLIEAASAMIEGASSKATEEPAPETKRPSQLKREATAKEKLDRHKALELAALTLLQDLKFQDILPDVPSVTIILNDGREDQYVTIKSEIISG